MPYRAIALVAASLLFATQCFAESVIAPKEKSARTGLPVGTVMKGKQTKQTGGNRANKRVVDTAFPDRTKGKGKGATAGGSQPANAVKLNTSRSN
jgi:hypothetical protein